MNWTEKCFPLSSQKMGIGDINFIQILSQGKKPKNINKPPMRGLGQLFVV
tara:strand:+ start:671 stop:820 length:150 start_codon:yes stop_codon:yes gene_type:complete